MVNQCNTKLARHQLTGAARFEIGDGELLPYRSNSFDVSVSLRLFGHLPSLHRCNVLKELRRVSKQAVVVAYYHRNTLQETLRRIRRRQKNIAWHPVVLKEIDQELFSVGLKRMRTYFLLPFVSETIVILAKKR